MKVLLTTLAAPPKTGGESLQVANIVQHLQYQCDLTIITEAINYKSWNTSALSHYKLDNCEIIRFNVQRNRFLEKAKSLIGLSNNYFPDNYDNFHKKINDLISINSFDVIYSRAYPLSSAVAGLKLKKASNKPWLLHLSDPWTLNPYHPELNSKKHNKYESECMEYATIVSFTNDKTLELYALKYPMFKSKFQLSVNTYNSLHTNKASKKLKDGKLILCHTGNLYGNRHPFFLLDAISGLTEDLLKKLEIVFVGNIETNILDKIQDYKNINISITGPLDNVQANTKQLESDLLVCIDGFFTNDDEALFMPSKLLEYMIAEKPILAITNKNSPTYNFVNNGYGVAVEHTNSEGISEVLKSIITDPYALQTKHPNEKYSSLKESAHIYEMLKQISNESFT